MIEFGYGTLLKTTSERLDRGRLGEAIEGDGMVMEIIKRGNGITTFQTNTGAVYDKPENVPLAISTREAAHMIGCKNK